MDIVLNVLVNLLFAYFLTIFNFNIFILNIINKIFNTSFTTEHYYFAFIILSLIEELYFFLKTITPW
jgi:hypothetical protein